MSEVRRRDVQDLIEELRGKGLAASSVHNKLDVLRVTFRRALQREDVTVDPFTHLELPAIRRVERRVADTGRAEALLEALPDGERALWAALFYGGLRISEARALRWSMWTSPRASCGCAAAGTTWRESWTTPRPTRAAGRSRWPDACAQSWCDTNGHRPRRR